MASAANAIPRATTLILITVPLSGCDNFGIAPQALDLIERTKSRVEHVDDEINEIEQHPTSLLQPFSMMNPHSLFFQLRDQVLAHCSDMRIRGSAGDDEVVRHIGDTFQIQENDVVGFHVLTQGNSESG